MPSAGIKMGTGVVEAYDHLQAKKKLKYVIAKIDCGGTEKVEVEESVPAAEGIPTQEEDYNMFREMAQRLIELNEPRYVLYDFFHKRDGQKERKAVFIYWGPDSYSGKLKMLYSSTLNDMSKCFGGMKAIQANDSDEIDVEIIAAEAFKKK